MTHALETIVEYINMPNTDYAVLIDGPWGCGKTYFWKNIVVPELVDNSFSRNNILYASLYGVENTRSIDTQLLLNKYSDSLPKKINRILSTVGDIASKFTKKHVGFDVSSLDLRWLIETENTIICLDDLERCKLSMKEILGYINHFVEHCNAKTIIICNEKEISSKEPYKRMKEKAVGFSFHYQADHSDVLQILINSFNNNHQFRKYLATNKETIIEIFQRSKTNNLRALNRTLNALRVVFDTLIEGSISPDKFARRLLYAVCPTALDLYALGANPDDLRSINSHHAIGTYAVVRGMDNDEESYERSFWDRYYSNSNTAWKDSIASPSICEYLITGHLNRQALIQQMKEFSQPDNSYIGKLKRFLNDSYSMTDNEFKQVASEILTEISNGQITKIGDLVHLFFAFSYYSSNRLTEQTQKQILQIFKDGIEAGIAKGLLEPYSLLKRDLSHQHFKPKTDIEDSFRQYIFKANDTILNSQASEKIQKIRSLMENNPEEFINKAMIDEESEFEEIPVFSELDPQEVISWIIGLSNEIKQHFILGLQARYEPPFSNNLADEVANLEKITTGLQAFTEKSTTEGPISISTFNLNKIGELIDKAIKLLKE